MKIKGTDKRTGREFLVEQVIENGGGSPVGRPAVQRRLRRHAGERAARRRGGRHEARGWRSQAIADLRPDFTLTRTRSSGRCRSTLDRLEQNLVQQG